MTDVLTEVSAILADPASHADPAPQRLGLKPRGKTKAQVETEAAAKTARQRESPATGAQPIAQDSRRDAESEAKTPVDPLDELDELTGDGAGRADRELDIEGADDSLKALAAKLGIEPADLYGVKVPMPNGEPMTIGQLKDNAKAMGEFEAAQAEWDKAVGLQRVAHAQEREEVAELLRMLPQHLLTPAMVNRARESAAQFKEQQAAKLLDLVPEWRDSVQYAADRKVMEAHVEQYGFRKDELASLLDARLMAYIRANARREARTSELIKRLKGASPIGRGFKGNQAKVKAANAARADRAAATGTQAQKLAQIDNLLKGTT